MTGTFALKIRQWLWLTVTLAAALSIPPAAFGQRRVFTNEDVQTTPPAPPPAATETQPTPTQSSASAADATATKPESGSIASIISSLGDAYELLEAKIPDAPDQESTDRWTAMKTSLGQIMTEFRKFAEQADAKAAAEATSAGQSEDASAPSPATP